MNNIGIMCALWTYCIFEGTKEKKTTIDQQQQHRKKTSQTHALQVGSLDLLALYE